MNSLKTLLPALTNTIHIKIFGHTMGKKMQNFIENIGWMGSGTLGVIIFSFITNLLAGRLLGPSEYGKYSLILSLGQILSIPMILGISTASVNQISATKTNHSKISHAKNTIFLSLVFTAVTILIYALIHSQISHILNVDNQILIFIIIYSSLLSFKTISESITRGFHQFRFLSFLEITNSFFVLFSFVFFLIFNKETTYKSIIIPVYVGFISYIILFSNKIYKKIYYTKINKKIINKIINYGKFATIGGISGVAIGNVDKLFINKYMTFTDIGLYSVYLSASSFISTYISQIFIQVFFPTISAITNKTIIIKKVIKIAYITFIPITLINISSTIFILTLFGKQYQKIWSYIILFSLYSTINIFSNVLWWMINSYGPKGIKFTSFSGILIGIFNILLIFILTPKFGIIGMICSLIITNIIIIIIAIIKLLTKNETKIVRKNI